MKIGYDAKRLFNNFTGLGNYSRFIVDSIHAQFPEEQLFLFTPRIKNHPEVNGYLTSPDYTIVRPSSLLSSLKLGSYWRTFLLHNDIKKHNIDIFHGLSHELPVNMPTSTRSVVTVHDLIFLRFPELYKPIDRWIYKRKVAYACEKADAIIAISEQTKRDLIELLGVKESKIEVVYQGCHVNFRRPITEQQCKLVREKYSLPPAYLLNVGTIEPRKNALLILKALHVLGGKQDIPLVIIGRSTAYQEELNAFAMKHNLQHRINYIHKAAFADLPAIYNQSTAFIYPSFYEGFGIPLVEAIACGTPVIAATGSCLKEAAGDTSLYVDPGSEHELAEAIQTLVTKSDVRNNMIAGATKHIEKFEPSIIAHDMMNVYQRVVGVK